MALSRSLFKTIFFFVALIFIYYCFHIYPSRLVESYLEVNQYYSDLLTPKEHYDTVPDGYLVWSPRCKIVDIDPWHETVRKHVTLTGQVKCSSIPPLTYIEPNDDFGNVLKINKTLIFQYSNKGRFNISCCFSIITRLTEDYTLYTSDADNKYLLSRCKYFTNETHLQNTTEFIFVKCLNYHRKVVYSNIHSAVPILPRIVNKKLLSGSMISKTAAEKNGSKERRLSVMILGFDSVSRLSFQRAMPNAFEFVQRNKWIQLKGYNKIGLNTFPNLLAVLNGRNESENLKKCTVIDSRKPKNICPLIWNDYKKKGYVTAYAEDTPHMSTFNYLHVGFVEQPTDYYLRPMMVAGKKLFSIFSTIFGCFGPESSVDHILNYAKKFSKTFKDNASFGFFWTNAFSHDNINMHGAIDLPLNNFLLDLSNIGTYENTLVILLSDHGMRYGRFRKTFVGYYEDHLPFIFIWVPQWFRDKYPKKYKNLLINQNRLTTPYDLHLMLKELIEDLKPKSEACPKCVSLFEEVPWNRSCEDAGIGQKYCMCSIMRPINVTDKLFIEIGRYLNHFVVNRTQELLIENSLDERICAERTFLRVISGFEIVENDKRSFFGSVSTKREYVIVIESNPGPALFEGKVEVERIERKTRFRIKIVNSVNRLDSYAKTSSCVNSVLLKRLCHCV